MSPEDGGRRATHAAPRFVAPMRRVPRMGIGTPRRPLRPTPRFFSRTPDCWTGEWAGAHGPKTSWLSGGGTAWFPAESGALKTAGVADARARRAKLGAHAPARQERQRFAAQGGLRWGWAGGCNLNLSGHRSRRSHHKTAPVTRLAATSPHCTRHTSCRDLTRLHPSDVLFRRTF